MDFNDIQSAWDNDNSQNVEVPSNLDKIKSANMPVDAIRKNLRNEFFIQIPTMILLGFLPQLQHLLPKYYTVFYLFYGIAVATSIYYLIKLYLFYRRISNNTLDTKDNLYKTYFDIKLNMELYKSFTYSLIPFALVAGCLFVISKSPSILELYLINDSIDNSPLAILILIFIVLILLIGLMTEVWVNFYYGKYAKQIKKVIDELKEE
ncbi:hypothetical protein [Flavobacterium sp. K5-23]|uniref:hypothetical protein n=1 Tax=Flavobacterium sp. K5-23 TaxID=2746225 RepID=UPI00200EBE23|nr:hypothetical protein [Flavobacterium sp. K5-23]UQD55720.1 hypothetical protein FLAK523_04645 [Flavobacterium sp. K5-23]